MEFKSVAAIACAALSVAADAAVYKPSEANTEATTFRPGTYTIERRLP